MTDVLARRDQALSPEEITALLRDRFGDKVVDTTVEFATFTVHLATEVWVDAVRMCRDESALAFDMFDCLFGVDAREDGFDVVAVIYSTSTGNRLALRVRCDGGREAPSCPSITDIYRGADWMERETWDMFGIDFPGHPGLEPRLLTVENFEGFPLRKDFNLTSRVAKPWPGVKEPVELDEDGNVIERVAGIGDAPGPYDLDKALAEQAKAMNAPPQAEVTDEGEAAADEGDDHEVNVGSGDPDAADADDGPTAQDKAEARRREQAEARRRKAEERAQDTDDEAEEDA